MSAFATQLQRLEDYQNAELYGHAVARQICRAAGMTFEQVIEDLDAAVLSRDRLVLREFLAGSPTV